MVNKGPDMDVVVIQTGGTIDKDYPNRAGAFAFEISDPAAARILDTAGVRAEVVSFLRKDSQQITDSDRRQLAALCEGRPEHTIIVTHGTDTMLRTADALVAVSNKTIVLTGAIRPERFSDSDATFNLGLAFGAARSREAGVYIAMSGDVIPAAQCRRDASTGDFCWASAQGGAVRGSGASTSPARKAPRSRREASTAAL